MSTVRRFAVSNTIAVFAFISVAHAATAIPAPGNGDVVQLGHRFELGDGESMQLTHHRTPSAYRICVKDLPGIMPLKVDVDGKKMEVMDGTCTDAVGANIRIMPSEDVAHERTIEGRFERVKG